MPKDLQNAFLEELYQERSKDARAKSAEKGETILARVFRQQRDMIRDKSRQKAALCPRRSGKSFAALHYALWQCVTRPGSKVLIVAKVRRQAKGVYWQKLRQICHELEIEANFRTTELEVELTETNSFINFTGADTMDEIEKFRGLDFDLVIIDEGKSYSAELLKELIQDVLKPTLLDRRGTLLMIGTPGAILAGPFYDITTATETKDFGPVRRWDEREAWGKKRYAWSLHGWTTKDNTACPWIWELALEDKEMNGWSDDHPTWRREYLAEWVPDDDAMVYAYAKANADGRCNWTPNLGPNCDNKWGLPNGHDWKYVLGLDLGYHDPTAFVVAAWAPTHKKLFYVHAEKHSKMTIAEIAARTKSLEAQFGGFVARIADTGGLGKMLVESMAESHDVYFEAAQKSDKHAYIKLTNSDYEQGLIQVIFGSPLHEELMTLQYTGSDRKTEDPGCANHCCDAALYIWRWCYHHLSRTPAVPTPASSAAWWEEREREAEERYRDQLLAEREGSFWEKQKKRMDKNPWEDVWNYEKLKRSLKF